jgi:PTH1 family peptidyl-tRNA hydrolase
MNTNQHDTSTTKLIVGLGNPGNKYRHTRHNIGFLVLDKLAKFFKIKSSETEDDYEFAVKEYKDTTIVLMRPLTFMNRSGFAVREFFENYEISGENVLIVYDDVNLDFGTIRLRPSGSDGGHKGMQSVIYEMHTEDIPRLRIGIKNPAELEKFELKLTPEAPEQNHESMSEVHEGKYDLAEYVLSNFTDDEIQKMDIILDFSKDAVLSFIGHGIEETMNKFNKNVLE